MSKHLEKLNFDGKKLHYRTSVTCLRACVTGKACCKAYMVMRILLDAYIILRLHDGFRYSC